MSHEIYTAKQADFIPPQSKDTVQDFKWKQDVSDALNKAPIIKTEFLQLSESSTISPTDRVAVYLCAGGITVTLPHPGKTRAMNFYIKNTDTTDDMYVESTSGTIDNDAQVTLAFDECAHVVSDGTNYWTL